MTIAEQIVNLLIEDIEDRMGFGDAWEAIDPGIQVEVREAWKTLIDKKLGEWALGLGRLT